MDYRAEADRVRNQIEERMHHAGMDLVVNMCAPGCPHWIFMNKKNQIAQYWPSTGRLAMQSGPKLHLSPQDACDHVLASSQNAKIIRQSRKRRKRSDEQERQVDRPEERNASCAKPALLSELVGFGVHRGLTWAEVPFGYLKWIISAFDHDDHRWITANSIISQRRANQNSASCALKNTVDKPESTPQQCAVTVRFPDKPMGEWDRKYLYWAVEAYGPETEIHQRAKELLVEEAPF